jgi:hypothetical protein
MKIRNENLLVNSLEENLIRMRSELQNIKDYSNDNNEFRNSAKRKIAHLVGYCNDRMEALEYQISEIK